MQTTIPLYGFGGGSGGTGATLTITAPTGATVTVSKDGKTKTKTAGADGVAVFKGLSTGAWTVTITDGEQTAQKTVTITADYSTAITFFSATIHVTYPAGSTCTATDGTTTLTAPDTSGTWDCVVPNAGTWTVTVSEKGWTAIVAITNNGQTEDVYLDAHYLFNYGQQPYQWQPRAWMYGTNTIARSPNVVNNTDGSVSLTINKTASEAVGGAYELASDIDLTAYSTLILSLDYSTTFSVSGQSNPYLIVIDRSKTYWGNNGAAQVYGTVVGPNQELTLDISALRGSYDVAIMMYAATKAGAGSHTVNMKQLKMME